MLTFITTPIPHAAAAKLIQNKPSVARAVFDELPAEIKGKAFTITGIEEFDVWEGVKQEIATLPAGADWGKVKKEIVGKISPWFDEGTAAARAELLMRTHAFDAYRATEKRIQDQMMDVFPYRQRLTTGDDKVRNSHRALNGIILPADHPFWNRRDWGCRCQDVELTTEDMEEERKLDEKRGEEFKRVMLPAQAERLAEHTITRGPNVNVELGEPMGKLDDIVIPYEQIRNRWEPAVQEVFEQWAGKILLDLGTNLLGWLLGKTKLLGQ